MELISAKELPVLFRKIKDALLFPPELADRHASFIATFRASITEEAFNDLCLKNWERTNEILTALLASNISEGAIRDIFERMTPEEAFFYEDRLRKAECYLSEAPETFLRRDQPKDEMFWIDLLKGLLVVPCPPPG